MSKLNKDEKLNKKQLRIGLIFIIFITLFAYGNAFKGDFLNWDDNLYVTENPSIKSLDIQNIKTIFTNSFVGNYHPLTMLSLALDYSIAGQNPRLFHVVNILLHLINTLLVFVFIRSLFRLKYREKKNLSEKTFFYAALISATIFGVHTIHVESVTWISERKDVLYAFFFLLSLISYLHYCANPTKKAYIFSMLFFLLSILSKAMAVSLPVVLLVIDYYFERKLFSKKIIIEKIPFFSLSLLFGIIAVNVQKTTGAVMDIVDYNFFNRVVIAGSNVVQYLFKLLIPYNLSGVYPYPELNNGSLPFLYWFGFILAIALLYYLIRQLPRNRNISFIILFFLVNVFLVLQLFPVGESIMADRYLYIPSIGYSFLFGYFYLNRVERNAKPTMVIPIILAVYVFSLVFITRERNKVWDNNLIFWTNVIDQYPNVHKAYNNRGKDKLDRKDFQGALIDFTKVIQLDSSNFDAYINMGVTKNSMGLFEESLVDYNKAFTLHAPSALFFSNRGVTYLNMKKFESALFDFNKAIELNPASPQFYFNRALAKSGMGNNEDALNDFDKSLLYDANFSKAYAERGMLLYHKGDLQKAMADLNKSIDLTSENADYANYVNRGAIFYAMKNYASSINDFSTAIQLNPGFANSYMNRGSAYRETKEFELAITDFSNALKIESDNLQYMLLRGQTYMDMNNNTAALNDFNTIIAKSEGYAPAYHYRGLIAIKEGRVDIGCHDLQNAYKLGFTESKEWIDKYCK